MQALADRLKTRIVVYDAASGDRTKILPRGLKPQFLPKVEVLVDKDEKCCYDLLRRMEHPSAEGLTEEWMKELPENETASAYCMHAAKQHNEAADQFQRCSSELREATAQNEELKKRQEELKKENEADKGIISEHEDKLKRCKEVASKFNSAVLSDPLLRYIRLHNFGSSVCNNKEKLMQNPPPAGKLTDEALAEAYIEVLPKLRGKEAKPADKAHGEWRVNKRCKGCSNKGVDVAVFTRFSTCEEKCKIALCKPCLRKRLDELAKTGDFATTVCFSCYTEINKEEFARVRADCEAK